MTTRLTELRKLAEEAMVDYVAGDWSLDDEGWIMASELWDTQKFIAAANPTAIIELISVVENMRDVLESIARREEYPIAKAAYALASLEKWEARE